MNNFIKKSILTAILISPSMLIHSMGNEAKVLPRIQSTTQDDITIFTCQIGNLTIVKTRKTRYDYETWQPRFDESYAGYTDMNNITPEDARKIFTQIESVNEMCNRLDGLVKQAEFNRQEKAQRARECSERIMAQRANR